MSNIEKGKTVIAAAESNLRDVIATAAKEGDYASLATLARWAATLMDMSAAVDPSVQSAEVQPIANEKLPATAASASVGTRKAARSGLPTKSKATKKYPRFVRRGDSIVKIGWSKKSKEEYHHKAPKQVLTLLSQSLCELGRGGKLISTSDVTPLAAPDQESAIPDYQVYLCLAWLREMELVQQEGRQGYRVSEPEQLQHRVVSGWERLGIEAK